MIIEDAVEDRKDDHIDVKEHHGEHCAELALVKQIHAGGQNDDSTAGVKQDFQQKNHQNPALATPKHHLEAFADRLQDCDGSFCC